MKKAIIRGYSLAYEDINPSSDNAILLVHGHPFDHSMWEYQYSTLQSFRIVNPDLFGYGQSEANFDKLFIEQQALDLALLLDQLHIDRVHLVGLSMGGQIIVEFARLFPHRTKSLVICASTPAAETEATYQKRMANVSEIEAIGMVEHTQKTITNYINTRLHPKGSEVYEHLHAMMIGTPDSGAIAAHRGRAERRDNTLHLPRLSVPVLVVAGELDYFFGVDDIQAVANAIPNSTFVLIEGSGHLPNMEQPDLFNQHLEGFYIRIDATSV